MSSPNWGLVDQAFAAGLDEMSDRKLLLSSVVLLSALTGTVGGLGLAGHGPPPAGLGVPGSTYVDLDADAFYWKSGSGWKPQ